MDNFNKEAFIDEVEKRPVIWNTECPEYSDRILKRKAWHELTEIFADPNYSKEKKSIFCIQLQRKWKNLKDTYMKEYKKIKSSASYGNQKGSNYMYYSKLSFLQKCLQTKPITSSNDSQMMEVEQAAKASELLASMNDSLLEMMETASNLEKSTYKLKSTASHSSSTCLAFDTRKSEDRSKIGNPSHSDIHRKLNYAFAVPDQRRPESRKKTSYKRHEDDDKLFCLSLYKEIKKVPENNRLAAKIELLNVLQRAQMLQTPPTNELPHWLRQHGMKPYAMLDSSLMSNELIRPEPSTSSGPRLPKQVLHSLFQNYDPYLKPNSPVSSLESSFSSNCSIHD